MKREFLQNFKVGDQPLTKEIIDAIMEENGHDIEAAKKPFADYETIKTQLGEAQTTITNLQKDGTTIEDAKKAATEWEGKYNKAIEDHKKEMADRDFNDALTAAITGAKGKNAKTIIPLLDVDALKASKNQTEDIKAALEAVKKDNGYLFDDGKTPPGYAGGTGGGAGGGVKGLDAIRAAAGLSTSDNNK